MTTKRLVTDSMTRRTALTGVATVGLGVPLLVACGSDDTASDAGTTADPSTDASSAAPDAGSAEALASTSDIKVGGGEIFADEKVVVTQPAAGEFKAFSAVCTHTGCIVAEVTSEGIQCGCHGSLFSSEDGSVLSGPASRALGEKQITVTGDQITLA